MSMRIGRIMATGLFVGSLTIVGEAAAQTTLPRNTTTPNRGTHNAACERILNECRRMGFIQGQWKKDNGLWKDCFDPIVKGGGTPTQNGRPVNVPVNPSDVQACRAAEGHRR